MEYNFNEYEKATLNALEYIMSELSTIARLIASENSDKHIRDTVKPLLDLTFARRYPQKWTLGQPLEPLSKEKKEEGGNQCL